MPPHEVITMRTTATPLVQGFVSFVFRGMCAHCTPHLLLRAQSPKHSAVHAGLKVLLSLKLCLKNLKRMDKTCLLMNKKNSFKSSRESRVFSKILFKEGYETQLNP